MHPRFDTDATHRHATRPAPAAPRLLVQLAVVAVVPLALFALAHPVPTALALAALAAVAWHRRVGRLRQRPRPTRPPD